MNEDGKVPQNANVNHTAGVRTINMTDNEQSSELMGQAHTSRGRYEAIKLDDNDAVTELRRKPGQVYPESSSMKRKPHRISKS